MTDLDKKLINLLENWRLDHSIDDMPRVIKQAFKDAGWVNRIENPNMIGFSVDKDGYIYKAISGQEWYDRLIRELPRPTIIKRLTTDQWFPRKRVIKAAKKAAGL